LKKTILILVLFLLFSQNYYAGGFQINEHGAKSMALGGAFTALANDPSAIHFNPAGLTQLPGTMFYGGVTLIAPSSSFRGPSPEIDEWKLDDKIFTPINLYGTHQLNEDWYIGVGINNPYGLGTKWANGWIGRFIAVDTEIRTFYFNGVAAYKVSDEFSVGGGIQFAYGDVVIKRDLTSEDLQRFDQESNVDMSGDGTGWGWTLGLLYKPADVLALGFSYRSQVSFEFTGEAEAVAPSQLISAIPQGNITAPLDAPYNATLGLALFPSKKVTITGDFQYIGWSSYETLAVTFEDIPDESGNKLTATNIRDYDDGWIARLGLEIIANEAWTVRGGLLYDKNPIKDEHLDPTLPDSDRIGFNVGFAYAFSQNLVLDFAYLFLRFEERIIDNSSVDYTAGVAPFNGYYNSTAQLFGINLSYKFN